MSWTLTPDDLPDLARGAALLGTGGGGDPYIGRLMVEQAMREHGPVTVLDPHDPADLADEAFVIATAMMGAPTVMIEKIPRGEEPVLALRRLEAHLGRTADATIPMECGGINSMIPLLVAARTGLPVIDADGMGRAFPELQMETFGVYGVAGSPMVVAGDHGESVLIDTGADNHRMEYLARGTAIRMGGSALIAEYPMSGHDVRRTAIPHTLTLALRLGRAIREARERLHDPVSAIAETLAPTLYRHLRVLFAGKVTDVERRTVDGFARGSARFAAFDGGAELHTVFQNETLVATVDGETVAVVPDLICVLEAESGEPITTEALRYGQRVVVVGISTPDMMRTPEALAVFGPACFGLDVPFVPVERDRATDRV
ncbi:MULTISPECIES: DUF917 domain-containing protein [Pseudonocardia]|uniref:DUF917 domain-containing protein n=2 Tax=Pseudonocardia TaxID=1847 RepID=A0A1Y2MIN6_PSEAH|nr:MULTISPECIES: DUF917 domain-containing protein [Pseudonocardia]OSY35126.1 hypothetical protein BG845_06283 [Pseudonocardia autotrophica]TDN72142.1 hypothetical protein C8E95_1191 [Pseudonocardia autotrophica]BBG02849.1 hypothetical protein Pdca_40580 [Pseudonocardia autotrophica]GEC26168.1 hypothetical protein PSA01_31970 [Pseudonocardia saturnea]